MTRARSALMDIQRAIYDLLTGDEVIMSLVSGVYDEVPEDAEFPYVTLGDAMESPRNSHDSIGRETVVTLHVWSKQAGFTEANTVLGELVALLDHRPLDVENHFHISTRFEFSQALRDPDPLVRHIPARFRIVTSQ